MRLWSIHPKYLDTKGLLAVWREGLLAQKVLAGETKGYTNHPQLFRFRKSEDPRGYMGRYLLVVYEEAVRRGYAFDRSKILRRSNGPQIIVTRGQVQYEWQHLIRKMSLRDVSKHARYKQIVFPDVHPIFTVMDGDVESWEKPMHI